MKFFFSVMSGRFFLLNQYKVTLQIIVKFTLAKLAYIDHFKLFSCSTHLSMKFILQINVKMPTIVGILTFISRINQYMEILGIIFIYGVLACISN